MNSVCYVAKIEWHCNDNALYLAMLPIQEQQYAQRYAHPQRLRSFIASRLLLRRCLSLYHQQSLDWRFLYHDKRLQLDSTQTHLHTSISHSHDWVACVLSEQAHCGIDIEHTVMPYNFMAIAKRFFAKSESEYLQRLQSTQAFVVFLDFWTRKEACVKAWHKGLAHHLAQLSFDVHQLNPVTTPECYQHLPLQVFCFRQVDWQLAVAIHSHTPLSMPPLVVFERVLGSVDTP
ncbi:MAG: 4'-phosphopantetheinyl transferase superfamily protein [Moraxellaceae bacterium]|nr:4'-phosphopantetheinyl transferase superfamily protein [Moraxellaceae bacterium]HQV22371.1 4'-phosphopantetheinyl transferase superfamily protein [Agitococcus sp.]